MPSDLLSSLTSLVTPDLVSKFAGASGESSSSVSRALGAAFPALLSGFASKADDAAGFESLFNQITSPANNASVLDNPGAWLADVAGGKSSPVSSLAQGALAGLFGGRTDGIANAIGQYAGLKPGAGRTLLSMATPFVLGYLLDVVKKRLLNANGLAQLFKRERGELNAAVPGDLRGALGFAGASAPPPRDREVAAVAPAGENKWWIWLIPLLLIPLLWWFFRPAGPEGTVGTDTVPAMAPASGEAAAPSGDHGAPAAAPATDSAMPGAAPTAGAATAAPASGMPEKDTVGAGAMDGAPAAAPVDSAKGPGAMGGQGASGKAK